MRWCERHGVGYVLGIARNARLEAIVSMTELALGEQYAASGVKQREIGRFIYAAHSWDRERSVDHPTRIRARVSEFLCVSGLGFTVTR